MTAWLLISSSDFFCMLCFYGCLQSSVMDLPLNSKDRVFNDGVRILGNSETISPRYESARPFPTNIQSCSSRHDARSNSPHHGYSNIHTIHNSNSTLSQPPPSPSPSSLSPFLSDQSHSKVEVQRQRDRRNSLLVGDGRMT